MDDMNELEDGEIEELSDSENKDKTAAYIGMKDRKQSSRKPNFGDKDKQRSFESWRKDEIKPKTTSQKKKVAKESKDDKDGEVYDMDDYELLLARHQLIQQQLEKVKGIDSDKKLISGKRSRSKKRKLKESDFSEPNSSIIVTDGKETCNDNKELSQSLQEEFPEEQEDMLLLEMRKELLAQTSKKNVDPNHNIQENNQPEFVLTQNNNVGKDSNAQTSTDSDKKPSIINTHIGSKSSPIDLTASISESQNTSAKVNGSTESKDSVKKPIIRKRIITRSQNAKSLSSMDNEVKQLVTRSATKKKRKRGGKRAKYLAYRAQQKIELEILEQQHAIAFDNYNSVPMDIDDDEIEASIDGIAPLPLIETHEIQPPLPPSDTFQPAEDQTSLSMTSSNVAWMPGYVEILESDTNAKIGYEIKPPEPKEDKENESNTKQPTVVKKEVDEKEVWALRAQALKSLACKRASKAKMAKKVKTQQKEVTSRKTLLKDIVQSNKESNPILSSKVIPVKVDDLLAKFKPPIHAPVVIQLGKEDFSSDEEINKSKKIKALNDKIKQRLQRKQSTSDEDLLKELQDYSVKADQKIRPHSLLVQKDQLLYKKLNSDISEKRILFRKQTEEVKTLQSRLQAALREKASTRRSYNKLHSLIKDVKVNLKEKISLRKKIEEEVLRAKSIVSVNKLTINDKGKMNFKMRQHIATLTENLRESYFNISKIVNNRDSQDSSQESDSRFESSTSTENDIKNKVLRKTADSVKNMSKEDLSKLERELREKLKKYRNLPGKSSTTKEQENVNGDEKILVARLPSIQSQKDLKKLKDSITAIPHIIIIPQIQLELIEDLQSDDTIIHKKTLIAGGDSKEKQGNNIRSQTSNHTNNQSYRSSIISTDRKVELKYKSQLTCFKSYRLSPYFRMQSKYSIISPTFSNRIDARQIMCKYDLLGTCNDNKCSYWHYKASCKLSPNDIVHDLVAYDLYVFDATPSMSTETKQKLLHSFTQQFMTQYSGKMSSEEQLLLLWNQLKESRKSRKTPLYECVNFEERNWYSTNSSRLQKLETSTQELESTSSLSSEPVYYLKKKKKNVIENNNEIVESQEVRYFSESYQAAAVMEAALKENPKDVKLWLSLTRLYLKQSNNKNDDEKSKENFEQALGVLSKSLEENRDSEELWIEYLRLFASNSTADELRELSYQAVMYAATYNVWWTCLSLESTYLGKQEICTEMIKFVLESDEAIERKSNALLETILYMCKLLQGCDKLNVAFHCLSAALGKEKINDDLEKIKIGDITSHLTTFDHSLLWVCYLSMQCFNTLPDCLFSDQECGASRLVNKKKFMLEWSNKTTKAVDNEQIRSTFRSSLESVSDKSLVAIKSSMILYENLAAFELSLGNTQTAVEIFHTLVETENSLVEGWVFLVLLYIKHSPMDTIVKIAEEATHKCEHDVVLVYFYSNWLFEKGMPRLALDKLTKCIHTYFQFETDDVNENSPDILYLYRKVLGLEVPYTISLPIYLPKASQELKFFYWLCYCLLLKIKEIAPTVLTFNTAVDEAFEAAVHQYTSRDNTKKLWGAYIDHRLQSLKTKESIITLKAYNELVDLILRSIVSVPSTAAVQHNQNIVWRDYSFQNKIIEKCLPYIPTEEHSKLYHKLINLMSDNIVLATRICKHEVQIGNPQQARIIYGGMLQSFPRCLPLWRMAIQVECRSSCIKEARWLYEEATKENPFCSILWKEYACFEITYTSDATKLNESLDRICERAINNGIDVQAYLASLIPT